MKTIFTHGILTFLTYLFVIQITAQPAPPSGMQWEEVPQLTDEFNSFDTNKWWKPLWNYGVPVQMRAQNSGVTNGNLWIKATLDNSAERWFETSRVMSRAQIKFPMYTECSMRTAHISAYNTFWFNNGDINNRDEIDIVENNSKPSCGCQPNFPWQMNSQYFLTVNGNDERDKGNFDNRNLSPNNPKKGVKWNEEYHTVGMWWIDNQNVQFYLDGEPAGSIKTTNRRFTRNQNMIWDLWTIAQPWAGGIAIKNDLLDDQNNTMYVDWVHTYRLVESTLSVADNSVISNEPVIYPNPVENILNVVFNKNISNNTDISFYNSAGELIKTHNLKDNNQILLKEFSAGIYFAKIINGSSISYKTIVKK